MVSNNALNSFKLYSTDEIIQAIWMESEEFLVEKFVKEPKTYQKDHIETFFWKM